MNICIYDKIQGKKYHLNQKATRNINFSEIG